MGKRVDWAGVRQGKLNVLCDAGKDKHGSRLWECLCACGATVFKTSNVLKAGQQSCSATCGVGDANRGRTKHGQATREHGMTKEYRAWVGIKQRCTDPTHKAWHRYGGRGITMCQEWIESFEKFYAHVGDPPTEAHTIDRMDNERGYEPGNVRWATRKEQANNRSSNTWVEYDGKRMTWAQWADHLHVPYQVLMDRVKRKQPIEKVLQPRLYDERNAPVKIGDRAMSLRDWAAETGISYQTLYARWRMGQELLAPVKKHINRS